MVTGFWIVVLIAVAGLVIYALAANPKASEIGRLMFRCALLAICLVLAARSVKLLY